eukprot:gene7996-13904_t
MVSDRIDIYRTWQIHTRLPRIRDTLDMAASRFVTVKNLGRMRYGPAIAKMKETCEQKVAYRKRVSCSEPMDIIYIVEHPPVYTIGTRTQLYLGPSTTDFERTDEKLKKLGAEFYKTNRGGLITFHGPGQLVCYPVLNLRNFKPSARWYINRLEQVVIDTCADFKINVGRTADIGVWTEDRKIAAIG